ncbi:peroxisomal membrane protein 2 [Atheta coriaria]|uniref:peroxisomal membrane protein 2 n=1 Tax=Dalotia coriaria TaxID=877792 RepID=UPI0031F364FA
MVLSKPLRNAFISYLSNLYENPIRTKAITCAVLSTTGNLVSQLISGNKSINQQSLLAYGLYGLIFGGTIPHFYYKFLEHLVPEEASLIFIKKLVIDRLLFTPLYQAFSLYMLARLEHKTHDEALAQLFKLYWPILSSSWKYLTILQLINITVVPPMLRVLTMNLVGFFWVIYVANVRREAQQKKGNKSD